MDAELYIGLMSGTSVDGIDAGLVDFSGPQPALIATHEHPWSDTDRQALLALGQGENTTLHHLAALDVITAQAFAEASLALLAKTSYSNKDIRAIGSHGQTILHQPNTKPAYTLQIGDPNVIAEQTGITTVADFRRRDLAKGGQGAPLAPAFHDAIFHSEQCNRVIVNIGGIANITVLPSDTKQTVIGFDTGPGNGLMDAWVLKHCQQHYDKNGEFATSGQVQMDLLAQLLDDDYFKLPAPKSTGRDYFNLAWLQQRLAVSESQYTPQDIQRTLLTLTAQSITDAILHYAPETDEVLICGGGAHNPLLLKTLQELLIKQCVSSTEKYNMSPDWIEAMLFAWLAKRTINGLSGNLPGVTGAYGEAILGGVYQA